MNDVLTYELDRTYTVHDGRRDLAAAHRLAVRDGLNEGTWNHFSLAVPGDATSILITPTIMHWSTVTASSLALLGGDEDREALRERDPEGLWVGYRIHYPLHTRRSDAACILHTHSPYATAFSMVEGLTFEPADQNALEFYGKVAYTEEFDAGMPLGFDQGEAMAEALGERCTVLVLRNHGAVVVGPTVAQAYTDLYLFERACRAQLTALQAGPLALIPQHRRGAANSTFKQQHFEAMKLVLDHQEPDYRD